MKSSSVYALLSVTSAALALAASPQNAFQTPLTTHSSNPESIILNSLNVESLRSLSSDNFEEAANGIASSLSAGQRESLLLKLWEAHDVVDVMRMTGHGEGLDEIRLVQVFGEDAPRNMTEGDKLRLKKDGFDFMDITDHVNLGRYTTHVTEVEASAPVLSAIGDAKLSIRTMLDGVNDTHLRLDIAHLSSFWTRNYRSRWGLLSSNWIYEKVDSILKEDSLNHTTTSVIKFSHDFFQNSIIARLESADDSVKDKEIIILSAHQDSLNYKLPFYRAPGADDDGSGSVTIMQVLRSLVEGQFLIPPHLALEFHWFAGEEGGLLGSQDVASSYAKAGKKIKGLLHMDMTAYHKIGTEPIVAFFDTNTDKNLTKFATTLVEEYLPVKWNLTSCGNTCGSDHMSFTKAGYPAAFATESLFRDTLPMDVIHTSGDSINVEGYSFEHMMLFVKLGIAFVAELSANE